MQTKERSNFSVGDANEIEDQLPQMKNIITKSNTPSSLSLSGNRLSSGNHNRVEL